MIKLVLSPGTVTILPHGALESQVAEARVVIGAATQRPSKLAFNLVDRMFIDAGKAARHETVFVELPVLIAIGTEPLAAIVMIFIGIADRDATPFSDRFRQWIADKRQAAGRTPRRYATLDDALARMMAENASLTPEQARHLTIHGISRNEDGTWSWKFDNYLNIWSVFDLSHDEIASLWAEITCPTLLLYGANSWASNPAKDGRIAHFKSAQVIEFENAGHWLHHDQFDRFMSTLDDFL